MNIQHLILEELSDKHITFCFGRMNPPTIGHKQVFKTMESVGGDYLIFLSKTQNPKRDPLDYNTKVDFVKKVLPEYADKIVDDPSLRTPWQVASYLYGLGYRHATFVGGDDRVKMYEQMKEFNGVEDKPHGFYDFETFDFVSSGAREEGAEGLAGISATVAREAAKEGDLEAFAKATGAGEHAEDLYNAVRKGMNISDINEADERINKKDPVAKQLRQDPQFRQQRVPDQTKYNRKQKHKGKVMDMNSIKEDSDNLVAELGRTLMQAAEKVDADQSKEFAELGSELTKYGTVDGASNMQALSKKVGMPLDKINVYLNMAVDLYKKFGPVRTGQDPVDNDEDDNDDEKNFESTSGYKSAKKRNGKNDVQQSKKGIRKTAAGRQGDFEEGIGGALAGAAAGDSILGKIGGAIVGHKTQSAIDKNEDNIKKIAKALQRAGIAVDIEEDMETEARMSPYDKINKRFKKLSGGETIEDRIAWYQQNLEQKKKEIAELEAEMAKEKSQNEAVRAPGEAASKHGGDVLSSLERIVDNKQAMPVNFQDGKGKVDMYTASAIMKVYDAVNDDNKSKMRDALSTKVGFMKMAKFAMSKVSENLEENPIAGAIGGAAMDAAKGAVGSAVGSMINKGAKAIGKAFDGNDEKKITIAPGFEMAINYKSGQEGVIEKAVQMMGTPVSQQRGLRLLMQIDPEVKFFQNGKEIRQTDVYTQFKNMQGKPEFKVESMCNECGKPRFVALPEEIQEKYETISEGKQKGVDGKVCWKGYKRMGTKKKGGKTVDNCVKMTAKEKNKG